MGCRVPATSTTRSRGCSKRSARTGSILQDAFRCANLRLAQSAWRQADRYRLEPRGYSGWPSDYLILPTVPRERVGRSGSPPPDRLNSSRLGSGGDSASCRFPEVTFERVRSNQQGQLNSAERRTEPRSLSNRCRRSQQLHSRLCQIEFEELPFRERWLVVDFRQKRPLTFDFDNGQVCDPSRPFCLFQLGKTHRRFEFMVLPGDECDTTCLP